MFYSTLLVINYSRIHEDLILKNLIDLDVNINISMFYEKQDSYKVIRELTYHIGNVSANIKDNNQNSQDIDIAIFTHDDAKYIRKEMQVNKEELYYLYIYINVFSENLNELEYYLNKIEGTCQTIGLHTRRAFFRQEQAYISSLPFMINNADIKKVARRNVLTEGLTATYPFISSSIYDENGIFFGSNNHNNSLVFIDRFNSEKYKNANMCIFGTSGAGKSFFTKLCILRNKIMGIEQYIVDPEREYSNLCENLGGTELKLGPGGNTYINILEIREESLEDDNGGYLATKINKLIGFFKLIFGELNQEEISLLEEKIIKCYELKNITFDDKSLYKKINTEKINIKPIFKQSKDMPILEDLYNILKKDKKTEYLKNKLMPFIKGSLKFFNNYTNIELNNNLIVCDVYDLGEENLKYGMYLITELFWDKIKRQRTSKKIIYLDEVWRLIGATSNKEVAGFIYKIFKTIRKYLGGAVAITQDISDIFSLDKGAFGKSIINNSSIKAFFYLEEENIKLLSKNIELTEREKIEIKSLKKGEALTFLDNEHILLKIESADFEKKCIE